MNWSRNKKELEENGYTVLSDLYSNTELDQIIRCIGNSERNGSSFLKSKELFAIRQLVKNIPELADLLFNQNMLALITEFAGPEYFLTKAIYFDKPKESNWFVSYHQDLSISVDKKVDCLGYANWTVKKGQFGVQPPIQILEDTITLRIHLDATNEDNGALKVIPGSHLDGVIRLDSEYMQRKDGVVCEVGKGGVMIMKPLILHASSKTTNGRQRRVIHLEFNQVKLTETMKWLEFREIFS